MAQVVNQLSDFLVINFPEIDEEDLVSHMADYSEKLEDLDDIQNVYTNADFPEEALESYTNDTH